MRTVVGRCKFEFFRIIFTFHLFFWRGSVAPWFVVSTTLK